jgi:hypothetical protein
MDDDNGGACRKGRSASGIKNWELPALVDACVSQLIQLIKRHMHPHAQRRKSPDIATLGDIALYVVEKQGIRAPHKHKCAVESIQEGLEVPGMVLPLGEEAAEGPSLIRSHFFGQIIPEDDGRYVFPADKMKDSFGMFFYRVNGRKGEYEVAQRPLVPYKYLFQILL